MNHELLSMLVCPACKGELTYKKEAKTLGCRACQLAYPVVNDIPVMLVDQAIKTTIQE